MFIHPCASVPRAIGRIMGAGGGTPFSGWRHGAAGRAHLMRVRMEPVPAFTGKVSNGELIPFAPLREKKWLSQFEGRVVKYSYRLYRDTRSNQQNSFYWSVVVKIMADYCGYDRPEDMHEALKERFNSEPRDHKGFIKIKSTTGLNTVEFEEYLSRIKRWAAEEGLIIPNPNEVDYGE